MKIRFFAALLLAALCILCFAGCGAAANEQLDTLEDAVEYRLDAAEDAIEAQAEAIITDDPVPAAPAPAEQPVPTEPAPTTPIPTEPPVSIELVTAEPVSIEIVSAEPVSSEPVSAEPSPIVVTSLLLKDDAEKIALEHAGFTIDQVQGLHAELDMDSNKLEYEVEFYVDRCEYNYDIDAATGAVLSWEKDLDD